MNQKLKLIIADGAILFAISSVIAICVHLTISSIKKKALEDPVITAILQGNLEETRKLTLDGAKSTNLTDTFGRTALMRAAYLNLSDSKTLAEQDESRSAITTLLLDQGAEINAVDNDGWTALMWSAWSGTTEVANTLLARGASVNNADRQGNTALTIAAQRGNAPIVKVLLAKGADAGAKTKANQTALDLAQSAKADNPGQSKEYQATLEALGGN